MALIALGTALALADMAAWTGLQYAFYTNYEAGSVMAAAGAFYIVQASAVSLVAGGFVSAYLYFRDRPRAGATLAAVVSEVLSSRRDVLRGVAAGIAYAVFYAFASSVIVYQPTVDFAQAYGVTAPGWHVAACCGSMGTVPAVELYVLPSYHLGGQVLPLDVLLSLVIPVLVGFNVAIASCAVRNRPSGNGGRWLAGVGAFVGVFTGCPTCAGLFLAGAAGGLGAAGLALALQPYQAAFISLSIPILVAGAVVALRSLGKLMYGSCAIA